VRISLAGVQEKLLLTRMPGGTWGRPVDGTPSTHILKPEIARLPNAVDNEAFCMRLAKHLGLPVASAEITMVDGRKLVTRSAAAPSTRGIESTRCGWDPGGTSKKPALVTSGEAAATPGMRLTLAATPSGRPPVREETTRSADRCCA
jgi:hypothetical protein